jgi:hypothetical protein
LKGREESQWEVERRERERTYVECQTWLREEREERFGRVG